jgi:hypothetical protein
MNLQFDAVLIGSLKRHRQTWEAIAEGAKPSDDTRNLAQLE